MVPLSEAELAMAEADRLAELGIVPQLHPISTLINAEEEVERMPFPKEIYNSIDMPVRFASLASGVAPPDFLLKHELEELARKKVHLMYMTRPLEEGAALLCASGMVDALIDTVAAYVQHLLVSNRKYEDDIGPMLKL